MKDVRWIFSPTYPRGFFSTILAVEGWTFEALKVEEDRKRRLCTVVEENLELVATRVYASEWEKDDARRTSCGTGRSADKSS
jgi:hypothetical protein